MSTCLTHGTFSLSVDLEPVHIDVSLAEQRALEAVANQLIDLVSQRDLLATWAVSDPAISALRPRIEQLRRGHELALLGDATWVGREAGRARFARELTRRMNTARQAGISLRTLVLRTNLPTEHCDLAIKEGLHAARQPIAERVSVRGPRIQTLRYGLWGFPASISLPGASRWLLGGDGARAARFEIDKAIAERCHVHLSLEIARLALRGSAVRVVERVLDHVTRRRKSGLLQVATIGKIAERLSQDNQGQPSRSILRPAA